MRDLAIKLIVSFLIVFLFNCCKKGPEPTTMIALKSVEGSYSGVCKNTFGMELPVNMDVVKYSADTLLITEHVMDTVSFSYKISDFIYGSNGIGFRIIDDSLYVDTSYVRIEKPRKYVIDSRFFDGVYMENTTLSLAYYMAFYDFSGEKVLVKN